MKVKVITGFRDDQFYTIDADEAHKAYYLFLNPEARTVFKNGTALIGRNIQGIEPDWHGTMGWNPTHRIDGDDWNEINGSSVAKKLKEALQDARMVAQVCNSQQELLAMPLKEAVEKMDYKLLS